MDTHPVFPTAWTKIVILSATLAGGPGVAAQELEIVAGPMFTPLDRQTVGMWIQTRKPARLTWRCRIVKAPPGFSPDVNPAETRGLFQTRADQRNVGTAMIPVRPGTEYSLEIHYAVAGSPRRLVSVHLEAPPGAGESGRYTIGFGSCAHQRRFPRQPIWDVVLRQEPDCFLFLGDNIYLPSKAAKFPETREAVQALYRDTYDLARRVPELQPLLRSTMCYAIWDDHDFGANNCDRTWKWADLARESLNLYFPNNYGLPEAPGCFYRFAWGDLDVFMLDDRAFRDPNKDPDRKTMLGERQLAWLKAGLAASKATFKLVVCGNQMLSECPSGESWGNLFRPERDAFLDWLWAEGIAGVIFLAGDRHFAELVRKSDPQKRGPDLWELTSSPLANFHFAAADTIPNPDRQACYAGGVNVGILRFDTTASPPRVEMLVLDGGGKVVIRQELTVRRR
jgi:alkaline phosphatase D